MPDDDAKHVQKIRQLLALAEHPDTPPKEKEAAFARAGMLMLKYEIEEADVRRSASQQEEQIILYDHAVSGRGGHGKERAWALGDVAEAMGCETAYRSNGAGNGVRWVRIVGPASTIENLKILLPAVLLQMESGAAQVARIRARELPTWLAPHERARETATIRRSFMRGFGTGIKDKLESARSDFGEQLHNAAASGDQTSASQELVLIDRSQRVVAEFKRLFPKLGKPRAPKHLDTDAFRQGVTAGRRADLGDNRLGGVARRELE